MKKCVKISQKKRNVLTHQKIKFVVYVGLSRNHWFWAKNSKIVEHKFKLRKKWRISRRSGFLWFQNDERMWMSHKHLTVIMFWKYFKSKVLHETIGLISEFNFVAVWLMFSAENEVRTFLSPNLTQGWRIFTHYLQDQMKPFTYQSRTGHLK